MYDIQLMWTNRAITNGFLTVAIAGEQDDRWPQVFKQLAATPAGLNPGWGLIALDGSSIKVGDIKGGSVVALKAHLENLVSNANYQTEQLVNGERVAAEQEAAALEQKRLDREAEDRALEEEFRALDAP